MNWTATDPDIRQSIESGVAIIIPVGSIEQHGPHLPVSTDSDVVGAVAAGVGKDNRFVVLPTITTGVSFEHAPFFQVSIRETTLVSLLSDMCESLQQNGACSIFVINGHYGNGNALRRFALLQKSNPAIHVMSYWRFMKSRFDHAGFVETSLMLTISDKVHMKRAQRGLITDGMSPSELRDIKQRASSSFPEATGNGIWGDPRPATAQDGRALLQEIVENLSKECISRINGAPNEILI